MSDGEPAVTPAPAPADGGRVPADPPVVEATGIVKRFGPTVALNGARITIRPGETHALVGRNGAASRPWCRSSPAFRPPTRERSPSAARAPRPADRDAWRQRVACVYQKSTIIPTLTVAENLFLHRHDRGRSRLISWQATRRRAQELLATWSVDVDPHTSAGELSVEQKQFVEIARALSFGARFIILDEPTAQLDGAAINRLFGRIRDLQRQGVTFLFISHHLQEVYEICDMVTVFRDARHIVTAPVAELGRADLVAAMTGEAAADRQGQRASTLTPGATAALNVRALRGDTYDDVSLQVGAGEIVGLAGAAGSGRTEVAETVVGLRSAAAGEVEIAGNRPRPGSVPAALAAGAGFVPQDRHHQGFVPDMSIADNATLSVPKRLGSNGFLSRNRRDRLAEGMIENLAIKTPGPDLPVSALSGGNQQKVVMARALADDPRLLVLINPTAGVDVRSKEFLLGKVEETAQTGTGVLIASDELDDLRMCDRVLVMFQGRVTSEIARGWHDHDLVAAMEGVALNA